MSQFKSEELKNLLAITSLHTTIVFLVKKYGPEAYPEEMDTILNNLSMLNPNFGVDRVMLFLRLFNTVIATTPIAEQWFNDHSIQDLAHEYYAELEAVREELQKYLAPVGTGVILPMS